MNAPRPGPPRRPGRRRTRLRPPGRPADVPEDVPGGISARAHASVFNKINQASDMSNNLALGTIGIPLVDEGTSIAAGFFQAVKDGYAIASCNTTGGIGDLGLAALDVAGGKIFEGLGKQFHRLLRRLRQAAKRLVTVLPTSVRR
jgi:hypothetical protein